MLHEIKVELQKRDISMISDLEIHDLGSTLYRIWYCRHVVVVHGRQNADIKCSYDHKLHLCWY
jgi:hypothetical protein